MPQETDFAPAERADPDQIAHDARMLAETGLMDHITDVIPSVMLVLNKERQAVYTNRRLQELLHLPSDQHGLGLRPGEILDCIHGLDKEGGCGTTEFCSECGAVKAILKSSNEKVGVEAECRITTETGEALELKVWASPYSLKDAEFTILSIMDIQHEKRRHALEHTFFTDITNMLSTIAEHSRLLASAEVGGATAASAQAIRVASKELAAEIWSQRKLLQAENNELQVEPTEGIDSLRLITEVAQLCSQRAIRIAPESDDFLLSTDRALLFRILFSMTKNAADATAPDETVTLCCQRENDTALFSVHNPGCMSRSVQLQLFQRSFSTKGHGRGMGTYSMRLFGEKYLKGKVGFNTSEHAGTTFYIALPLEYPE